MLLRSICAASLFLAAPAHGLSCKPPNFGERFNEAAAAEEVYSLHYGVLTPGLDGDDLADGGSAPYLFEGKQLGRQGFGETEEIGLILIRECAGSFCGPLPTSGVPLLLLAEHRGDAMVLTADPCGTNVSLEPGFGRVAAIRACMRALACGPEEIEAFATR